MEAEHGVAQMVNADRLRADDVRPKDAERFWRWIGRGDEAECWEWLGSLFRDGYGNFKLRGKSRRSHRVALAASGVDVPEGLVVRHDCDNRLCCNPAHLRTGTPADNARDAMERGRLATGDRNGSRLHPERLARGDRHASVTRPESLARGARHWMKQGSRRRTDGVRARLSEDDVREIRRRYTAAESQASIAADFGVSSKNVGYIVRRQTWTHVA